MTRTDPIVERLEAYLADYEGLTPLPEVIRDEIHAALPTTKQLRPVPGLSRFQIMNGNARFAVAAAILALAAIIGIGIYRSQVGPAPDSTPSPSASTSIDGAGLPPELAHIFLGPGPTTGRFAGSVAALHIGASRVQYELDANRGNAFGSDASLIGPGRIRLTTSAPLDCERGDEGIYTYAFSPGGNFLTLTAESDDCTARAETLAGDWQRSDCKAADGYCLGSLEAGTYASAIVDPRSTPESFTSRFAAITYTVPDGWANFLDEGLNYGLTTASEWEAWDGTSCFDCSGTRDLVEVLVNPGAARLDCTEAYAEGVGFGRADLVAWLESHPGVDVTDVQDLTINGRQATSLVITQRSDWTGTCPETETESFVAAPVFYHQDSWHWALAEDQGYGIVLIDIGGGSTAAVMIDSADQADLPAFMDEAMPIIETFEFAGP